MTIRSHLLLLVVLVAGVPLAVSAWMALRVHQRAFDRQVERLQRLSAETSARQADLELRSTMHQFELLAGQVEWPALTDDERIGALWLTYHQAEDVAAVALLDAGGRAIGPLAYESGAAASRREPTHPALSPAASGRVITGLLATATRFSNAAGAGTVFAGEDGDAPILPMVFPVAGAGGSRWKLAIALSLGRLCAQLSASPGGDEEDQLTVDLLDETGRVHCPRPGARAMADSPASLAEVTRVDGQAGQFTDWRHVRMQAVASRLPSWGWRVVTMQPAAVALRPGRRILIQTLIGIAAAVALAIGAGLLVARRITNPLDRFIAATAEIAAGHPGWVDDRSGDELATLAQSFNRMSITIRHRDAEIRGWNQQLMARVELQVSELREAQEQILRSEKLAAINTLGAGFAHEINNPLTSVMGFTQALLARRRKDGNAEELRIHEAVHEQAQRIMKIVERLKLLARDFAGDDFRTLLVPSLLDDAMAAFTTETRARGVRIAAEIEAGLPRISGNPAHLKRALREIYKNAIAAMPTGGQLTIGARALGAGAIVISIGDTGVGIAPDHLARIFDPFYSTKPDGNCQGLGLSVVHEIITRHHGRIAAESVPGVGTTMRITMPVAVEAHLV